MIAVLHFCALTHVCRFVLVAIHQATYRIPSAIVDKTPEEISQHHYSGVVKDINRRSKVRWSRPPAAVRDIYVLNKEANNPRKLEPTVDSISKAGSVEIKSRHDIGIPHTHYSTPNHSHLPKPGFQEHLGYHPFTSNDGFSSNNYRVPRNKSKGRH